MSARQANPAMMRSRDVGRARTFEGHTFDGQTFGRRETAEDVEAEPKLRPPPRWLIALAGVAVAALMGAMVGAVMHV
ncbi:hypothetical protein [Brevundimonas sp. SORGH_AS_0993]|uniref:hypothetical protein n=1 Tax=Brevundimonas sp. SORGH_AS_0993 TaxID=3041794 RepID=UPI0027D88C9D|nr:hypothetical protein [Brevundimonas sp. SORGH_AS_0993]